MARPQKAANEPALKNADLLVWRVLRARKSEHDREITRLYNARAHFTPPTKH